MVIRKIPEKTDLIDKGAPVKSDLNNTEWKFINVRILGRLIHEIDSILEERIGISRTGWILEAIQEKLKRDSSN